MVQLKSFKFIEPDGPTQPRSANCDRHVNQYSETEANAIPSPISAATKPNSRPISTSSKSSSSSSTIASSSPSISTIAGGNLTIESSQPEPDNQTDFISPPPQQQQTTTTRPPTSNSTSSNGSSSTILSASEEYQQAKYDIGGEDTDNDNPEASPTRVADSGDSAATGNPVPVGQATPAATRGTYVAKPAVAAIRGQQVPSRFSGGQSPLVANNRRPLSPVLAARQVRLYQSGGDSISQHSFGGGKQAANNNNNNHFEIRWNNINLMARRSKLPRFIADNQLYKLLKGKQEHSLDNDRRIYHSPPLNKRIISVIPEIGLPPPIEASAAKFDRSIIQMSDSTQTLLNVNEYRPILTGISGSVFSGQLTAILGPSGVGKTSLLNSLTGRNTLDGTGRVSLLGAGARKRMSVVTVPQADVLPGKLTALEDLRFTSRLKNPQKGFDHKRNIERIVCHLQMEKFLHTRIDKLSGGEQRRLSIGRELLNSPDIMILDEPTSGLDAMTCKKIIMALRDIVEHSDNILDRPMSIIVTIHQPQQEVLNLFHRLYIMALGGSAIYEGPPSNLLSHLIEHSSLSSVTNIEQLNDNPAIVAIEVASGEYGPEIISELAQNHEMKASDYFYGGGGELGQSPYLTPRTLRAPRKSPLSVSPRFDLMSRKAHLRGGGGGIAAASQFDGISLGSGPRTPTLINKKHHQMMQSDRMSSITSLSYASTYDADLPEQTSRLKVDKRLRRSVVIKSDLFSQTLTLMQRCWILTVRDTTLMFIRILGFLLIAGGMVQIFSHALDGNEHQCPVYQSEVDDILSFMDSIKLRLQGLQQTLKQATSTHTFFFHLTLCTTIVSSALTGLVFPLQMRMFIREYKNGWYSPGAFITSSTLAELPIDTIGPIVTVLIIYPLCNQPPSDYHWREIGYVLVVIVSTLICKSQAQITGAFLMDSIENSVFISCVAVTPPAVLSGLAVRVGQMPKLLQYISYGSFLRYAQEILFLLRYGYGICPCNPNIINGYPVIPSQDAIPERLDTFARGVMDLSGAGNISLIERNQINGEPGIPVDQFDNSLFVRYIRLVTDASNLFMSNSKELGDCNKYRSLYLLQMEIDDHMIEVWFPIMILFFITSRIVTYYAVKIVIKMRR